MFSKIRSAVLALAAVATLGLGAIVATTDSADARGFGGGGFKNGVGGGRHIGHRPVIGHRPIIGHRPHFGHHRPHIGHRHIHLRRHIHIRPHWCHRWHFGHRHRCHIHVRWPRPVIVGAVAATSYAVAPAYTARPCTCLTKEYTPDNLVVFKDLCTKEVASAPAGNTQVQLPAGPAQQ
jgi:hypothetical protein